MPWFANIVNFLVLGHLLAHWSTQDKRKFLNEVKNFYWDDPYLFKYCPDQIFRRCIPDNEVSSVIKFCHSEACGDHFSSKTTTVKILQSGFCWPPCSRTYMNSAKPVKIVKRWDLFQNIESLDNLLLTLKSHHNADVHCAIHDL
jgi:hypothetical protein